MLESSDTTVVTAFYPMKSKMGREKYLQLIRQFWPALPQCRLLFFTDPSLKEEIEGALEGRLESRTQIICTPFEKLSAFTEFDPTIWRYTEEFDPEKSDRSTGHSPELYAIWYEKKEFVRRAIELNPFQSEYFVWCDAGIGRCPEWLPLIQGFPTSKRIPHGQMLVLEVEGLQPDDFEPGGKDGLGQDFSRRIATVGGGILASDRVGWNRWSKAYDAMLLRYLMVGRFIGKDQNIMASMILEDPSLAICVEAPSRLGSTLLWFYLLFFLAGISIS